jgi:hypothetical protein
MINYNILAKERKEKGITWGHLESCIGSGYRGKFVDFKKGKTSLTKGVGRVTGAWVQTPLSPPNSLKTRMNA